MCVLTDVPQPFAREWLRMKKCENLTAQFKCATTKDRSLISGCGMSRGFHPRSACSLRERRGTSGSTSMRALVYDKP